MSKQLLAKLERYEQEAYDGGFGEEWLIDIGEGFKFYIQDCVNTGRHATIAGFERYLDRLHREANTLPESRL